jgi:hypothetical protein
MTRWGISLAVLWVVALLFAFSSPPASAHVALAETGVSPVGGLAGRVVDGGGWLRGAPRNQLAVEGPRGSRWTGSRWTGSRWTSLDLGGGS